jgi:hypothetical protein
MSRRRAYTYQDLIALRGEGKTLKDIGLRYGITDSAVAHALSDFEKKSVIAPVEQALTAMSRESVSAMNRLNYQAELIEDENKFTVAQMKAADPETAKITSTVICPQCKHKFETMVSNRDAVIKIRMQLQDRVVKNATAIGRILEVIKQVMKEAYNLAQTEEFKRITLEEIGRESPETQSRILDRIRHASADRRPGSNSGGGTPFGSAGASPAGPVEPVDPAAERDVLFRGARVPAGHSSRSKPADSPEERLAARGE